MSIKSAPPAESGPIAEGQPLSDLDHSVFKSLVESSPIPHAVCRSQGEIAYLNPVFTRTFGFSRQELPSLHAWWPLAFPEPAYRSWVIATWEERLTNARCHGATFAPLELTIRCKDNSQKVVLGSATVLTLKDLSLMTLVDISLQKEREADLTRAQQVAEEASQSKSAFLASMSHEIRTPLNGIIGMIQLLMGTPLSEEQRDFADTIRSSSESLGLLINDILDFSKIEAGRLTIVEQRASIRQLFSRLDQMFRSRTQERGLSLSWVIADDVPQHLLANEHRIGQVLINLLGNAIKFSKTGGAIRFAAEIREKTAKGLLLHFTVSDQGIGISPEKQLLIFKPFIQADEASARSYGGTGLGLSISKRLTELMGGTIWVESIEHQGSVFHFTVEVGLDASEAHAKLESPTPSHSSENEEASPRQYRILLVEDNLVNQKLAKKILENSGHLVVLAADGEEAIETLKRDGFNFDLVLMDCQMPRMSGYQATEAIRRMEASRGGRISIVAVTANAMLGAKERCLRVGMDDYIAKPFSNSELIRLVKRWGCETKMRKKDAPVQ